MGGVIRGGERGRCLGVRVSDREKRAAADRGPVAPLVRVTRPPRDPDMGLGTNVTHDTTHTIHQQAQPTTLLHLIQSLNYAERT